MTQLLIEGTWEEVLAQQDKLRGKRVRVTVLEERNPEVQTEARNLLEFLQPFVGRIDSGQMDFADASVVAAAEFLGISEIFTVGSHFYIYRLRDGPPLTVVPRMAYLLICCARTASPKAHPHNTPDHNRLGAKSATCSRPGA